MAERSLAVVVGGFLGSYHEVGEVGHGYQAQVHQLALVVDDGVEGGVAGGGEGFLGVAQLLALGRAGQGRAGPARAGQGRPGPGRAGQGRAGPVRAGQGRSMFLPCKKHVKTSGGTDKTCIKHTENIP